MNQIEAAQALSVSVDRLREWEADRAAPIPRKNLGQLKVNELCYLFRRRKGITQRQLAVALGCTRLWLIQMEDGRAPVERLRAYWGM